jgi:hypothetical protein
MIQHVTGAPPADTATTARNNDRIDVHQAATNHRQRG